MLDTERGLHGLNRHSLNKDFSLLEPQSIKALPICFPDKARVISHRRMRICVGEMAPEVLSFVKRSRMDYLRKYQPYCKWWWFPWCFTASFTLNTLISFGWAAMHHTVDFVYRACLHTKTALIALCISGQGWMCIYVCVSGCLRGKGVCVLFIFCFSAGCVS